ncbi:MAG TPA: polysaccharide biosynthesis C-terminal domain-containing protein, partial [Methylomirabilota bacterium]|nr:polysaccharide biosynthesis C-terminal domain-containing protein [Methylomirabilota bacterium]
GALFVSVLRWQFGAGCLFAVAMAALTVLPGMSPSWRLPLLLTAVCVWLLILHGAASAFLSALGSFRRPAIIGTVQLAVLAALVAAAAGVGGGVTLFLTAHALSTGAGIAWLLTLAWREGRAHDALPAPAGVPPALRSEVVRYARSVLPLLVLDAIVWQRSEVAFLRTFASPAMVAYYALAYGLASQMSRVPYQITLALTPAFPALVGAGRLAELASLHATAVRYLVLLGAPLAVGLAVVAPRLVSVLYGPEYGAAAPVLALLALGFVPSFAAGLSPAVLHATKHQRRLVSQAAWAATVNLVLALVLVPPAGAIGAALANVAAQTLHATLVLRAATRITGASLRAGRLGRIAAATAGMAAAAAAVTYALPGSSGLASGVVAGAASYVLGLRLFHALDGEDLDRVRVLLERLPVRWRLVGLGVAARLCCCVSGR